MWAVVTLNRHGIEQARKLRDVFPERIEIYTLNKYVEEGLLPIQGDMKEFNAFLFNEYKVIIYIMAMGIVVRNIAPYMKHKSIDPAVLCMPINGQHIIPVLSGHLGGANGIAMEIADRMGAEPIITTASDLMGKTAVDMIAKREGLVITSYMDAKIITAMMIENKKIVTVCEPVEDIYGVLIPPIKVFETGEKVYHSHIAKEVKEADAIVYIGYEKRPPMMMQPYAKLVPKRLVVGIGCRKNTTYTRILALFKEMMRDNNLDLLGLACIASIDLKKDEKGIIALAKAFDVPFITYSSEALSKVVDRYKQSEFVKSVTGVGAVAMPSGDLASDRGRCLVERVAKDGITLSVFETIK